MGTFLNKDGLMLVFVTSHKNYCRYQIYVY